MYGRLVDLNQNDPGRVSARLVPTGGTCGVAVHGPSVPLGHQHSRQTVDPPRLLV